MAWQHGYKNVVMGAAPSLQSYITSIIMCQLIDFRVKNLLSSLELHQTQNFHTRW